MIHEISYIVVAYTKQSCYRLTVGVDVGTGLIEGVDNNNITDGLLVVVEFTTTSSCSSGLGLDDGA